jgi:hypothetical protein
MRGQILMYQIPKACSIAFKEWSGVCDALASGRQTLIIRKGGIEEGPSGFAPEHPTFWLYPTFVHEGEQGLKPPSRAEPPADPGIVPIRALVMVESVHRVDDLATLLGLDDLHVWTEETIRKRFLYRKPGVWVLGVRIFTRAGPIPVPVTPAQLGCKSWVPLEQPLETSRLVPVRTEQEAETDRATLAARLGTPRSPARTSPTA